MTVIPLVNYMTENGFNNSSYGDHLQEDRAVISRAVNGQRIPRKPAMRKIFFDTKGRVQPNHFYLSLEELALYGL